MSRFFLPLLVALLLGASLQAGAQPARGLIVKLKDADAASAVAEAIGARVQPHLLRERLNAVAQDAGNDIRDVTLIGRGHHLMRFARPLEGAALEAAARRMRLHPDVAWAEPDVLMKPLQVAPNDTFYTALRQTYLDTPAVYAAGVNLPPAWARTTGGEVVVAVLDTGVRFEHPELKDKLLAGYDFVSEVEYANDGDGRDADPSDPGDWVSAADKSTNPALFGSCSVSSSTWHGTFISGQIAAATNNLAGVAGVNWNTHVLPVRVSGKCGAFLSDILDGMRWAAGLPVSGVPANPNKARIINLSFGGDIACTPSYQDVIDEVTAAGALVVVAAGNDNAAPKRPADCQNVLAVGAVQTNGLKTSYSSFGPAVALSAPGGWGSTGSNTNIFSSVNLGTTVPATNDYGYKLGTSFSAPLAAGVASLMLSLNPGIGPTQLITRLKASARAHTTVSGAPACAVGLGIACTCTTSTCGAGLLDAGNATRAALSPVALIAGVGAPTFGSAIALDGRASAAVAGSSITAYQWTQVAGPAVAITNAGTSQAAAVLPGAAGTFRFRLQVTDNQARSGEEFLSVTTTAAATVVSVGTDGGGSVTTTTPTPRSSMGSTGGGGGGGGGPMSWLWGAGLWLLALWAWGRRKA
jgi:serine protease